MPVVNTVQEIMRKKREQTGFIQSLYNLDLELGQAATVSLVHAACPCSPTTTLCA